MKNAAYLVTTLFLALFTHFTVLAQQETPPPSASDPTSTVNYYEIQNARINFFSVNRFYKCVDPKIYFIDRPGFIINLGWDSVQLGSDWYIILTYPGYRGGKSDSTNPAHYYPPQDIVSWFRNRVPNMDSLIAAAKPDSPSTPTPLDITKSGDWERVPLNGYNGKLLLIKKSDFDQLTKTPLYSTSWKWSRLAFSSGQLTVPFKLRPGIQGKSFSMTTDVTIGAYAGIKKRISKRQNFFLTLPVVAGLTLINVNDHTTSPSGTPDPTSGVVPGWTVATGLIAQLNSFNIGVVTGWDFASDQGKSWIYQGKQWISFGIGYSFLK